MLNIYEQVERNKTRSAVVIAVFVLFLVAFFWLLGQFFSSDQSLVFWAIVFSLFSSLGSYFWGDKIILAISQAKPANKEEYFNFYTVAENLAIASQIPLPKLYVIESAAMNAFATGRDPQHAVVCVTTGLVERLTRSELEGVIAHEYSHILNFDIRLMMIVAVLVGSISLVSDWIARGRLSARKEKSEANSVFLPIAFIFLIFSPLIAKLIQLAISRRREYLADASAVKLTKQPQGLIAALKKLSESNLELKTATTATAHLYIVRPKMATLFSTHPPIEERINILEKML